ncbi:MAG TPA: hypothetical protein VK034_27430 [Enhygromyxa sp.]|nr:hypothetical protein [Enhygromyxa sp.]
MEVFLLTVGIIAALMGGMAVGVIFSNKPLRGSCGGVGGSCACEEAGTPGACKIEDPKPADASFKAPGELMQLRK